ncbi:MAG: hypothetical protein Q9217_001860 [Psora testacea]
MAAMIYDGNNGRHVAGSSVCAPGNFSTGSIIEKTSPPASRIASSSRTPCIDELDPPPGSGFAGEMDEFQQGYGKVAAFEDCDPTLNIYRKFGWLHDRTLLHLQDELSELERELKYLDEYDFKDGDHIRLISRRYDYGLLGSGTQSERKDLINEINAKLKEYDELLLRTRQIKALKRPTERAQRSLFSLIKSTQSLVKDESDWIRHSLDLAALSVGTEHGWFNEFLEDSMNNISRRMTRWFFTTSEQRTQAGKEVIQLTSPVRRDNFLRVILTTLALILLLVPVFILFKLQPSHASEVKKKSNYQILTVFLFTLFFSASCSIFTRARRQEVFSATAAYCAVLVIFLGNTSNVVVVTNWLPNLTGG